jgi:hypothetical protein
MLRSRTAVHGGADLADAHRGGEPGGVHFGGGGRVEQVAALGRQQGGVAGLVARIGGEVLVRRELGRVDEQAGHNAFSSLAG